MLCQAEIIGLSAELYVYLMVSDVKPVDTGKVPDTVPLTVGKREAQRAEFGVLPHTSVAP